MEDDRNRAADGWFYAPAPPDTRTYRELGNFTVDGETFAVRRCDEDRSTQYDWVSGPNDGYGFNTFGSSEPLSHGQRVACIRDFLAGIDPATGYLRDP